MRRFVVFVLLLITVIHFSCKGQSEKKINGVSFVASPNKVTQKHINPVIKLNANYAAIMPFGFIKSLNSPEVKYNSKDQWFGESVEGAKQYITELHKNNIEVMLKPQLWVWRGEFTGNINMKSEEDWKILERTYESFILDYAKVAQEKKVSVYCVGTELEQFVKFRPDYWKRLIEKVKAIYKGELTYAANWDEYTKTHFWEALDYMGIDGYFPLSKNKTPQIQELKKGWQKHKIIMKRHADSLQKKVLFTEFGYRSVDYSAHKPWEVDYSKTSVNLQGQVNTTQVLFEELWDEEWFAGGFVWKWFIHHDKAGGKNNPRFTPQNKPAEEIVRGFYGRFK